jgi:5-deoxy-glucuronate isomerase
MEAGATCTSRRRRRDCRAAVRGKVTFQWNGETVDADRPDCFLHDAYCLLAPRKTKIVLTAQSHSELYIQKTIMTRTTRPSCTAPTRSRWSTRVRR